MVYKSARSTRQVAAFSSPWEITDPNNCCLEWNFHKMSLTKPCSEFLGTYIHHCLSQRDDILLGRRDQTEHSQRSTEDHSKVSKGSQNHLWQRKMSVWSGTNWVLQTGLHQGWTEAITWQSKSSQRVWSAWEQRGSTKFPGNGRLPGQLHQELCSHSSIAVPGNKKRNQILLG